MRFTYCAWTLESFRDFPFSRDKMSEVSAAFN